MFNSQSLRRLQQMENLANYRSQLAAATKLTCSLTEAVSTQCQQSTAREGKSFLEVLTPAQTAKYHEWVAANQGRCSRVIRERRPAHEKSNPVFGDSALIEFCKRLEEVLRISKGGEHEMVIKSRTKKMGSFEMLERFTYASQQIGILKDASIDSLHPDHCTAMGCC